MKEKKAKTKEKKISKEDLQILEKFFRHLAEENGHVYNPVSEDDEVED